VEIGSVCSKEAYSAELKKIPVDLQRKPSMLEAAAHTALFPCER
jgi:hypothetical protein